MGPCFGIVISPFLLLFSHSNPPFLYILTIILTFWFINYSGKSCLIFIGKWVDSIVNLVEKIFLCLTSRLICYKLDTCHWMKRNDVFWKSLVCYKTHLLQIQSQAIWLREILLAMKHIFYRSKYVIYLYGWCCCNSQLTEPNVENPRWRAYHLSSNIDSWESYFYRTMDLPPHSSFLRLFCWDLVVVKL